MEKHKWPIIYVRGYAMTQKEIDETTADPFCGFNLGSTMFRATPDKEKPPRKYLFESPLVRLGLDHQYTCVYDNGLDILDNEWEKESIPPNSIIIYRYYDSSSTQFRMTDKTPHITEFAKGLSQLIARVRDLVCSPKAEKRIAEADFQCFLVAHSMGGLVCRTFLQNPDCDPKQVKDRVARFFTYATPHNGIDMLGVNVPKWLTTNEVDAFNREKMAAYLKLENQFQSEKRGGGRVDWLPEEAFASKKVFCMIGSNRLDYEAAMGLSRSFVGHGSDGLVRIENASVWGMDKDGKLSAPCATAYAYRAHSGHYGIVNSEEAYQNLSRFLFGDVRIDLWAEAEQVKGHHLPQKVLEKMVDGRKVNALYQFEVLAAPRGKRWYLTRRVAEEDSVACRTLKELMSADPDERTVYLSTVFLAEKSKVDPKSDSVAYAVTLRVRVPDYEVEGAFFGQDHFEGGNLFNDMLTVEIFLPKDKGKKGDWTVKFAWDTPPDPNAGRHLVKPVVLTASEIAQGKDVEVPFVGKLSGKLRFRVSGWN